MVNSVRHRTRDFRKASSSTDSRTTRKRCHSCWAQRKVDVQYCSVSEIALLPFPLVLWHRCSSGHCDLYPVWYVISCHRALQLPCCLSFLYNFTDHQVTSGRPLSLTPLDFSISLKVSWTPQSPSCITTTNSLRWTRVIFGYLLILESLKAVIYHCRTRIRPSHVFPFDFSSEYASVLFTYVNLCRRSMTYRIYARARAHISFLLHISNNNIQIFFLSMIA